MQIYALHGFIGVPSDWDHIQQKFNVKALSLYCSEFATPEHGLAAWAESFNHFVAKDPKPKVLLAYSLGGRLALHALIQKPQLWQKAIIVSAHPGGLEQVERIARQQSDETWAKKFISDPWENLMAEWNKQSVFTLSTPLPRKESDYDRQLLADSIIGWSVARQEDLKPKITELQLPLLWLNGEHDRIYTLLSRKIALQHSDSKKILIPNAGHRAPWDSPSAFIQTLCRFTEL